MGKIKSMKQYISARPAVVYLIAIIVSIALILTAVFSFGVFKKGDPKITQDQMDIIKSTKYEDIVDYYKIAGGVWSTSKASTLQVLNVAGVKTSNEKRDIERQKKALNTTTVVLSENVKILEEYAPPSAVINPGKDKEQNFIPMYEKTLHLITSLRDDSIALANKLDKLSVKERNDQLSSFAQTINKGIIENVNETQQTNRIMPGVTIDAIKAMPETAAIMWSAGDSDFVDEPVVTLYTSVGKAQKHYMKSNEKLSDLAKRNKKGEKWDGKQASKLLADAYNHSSHELSLAALSMVDVVSPEQTRPLLYGLKKPEPTALALHNLFETYSKKNAEIAKKYASTTDVDTLNKIGDEAAVMNDEISMLFSAAFNTVLFYNQPSTQATMDVLKSNPDSASLVGVKE